MRVACFVAVVLAALPAAASNPGQPLDCSDWVIVKPGISCSVYATSPPTPWFVKGHDKEIDNEGNLLVIEWDLMPNCDPGGAESTVHRVSIKQFNGSEVEVVAYTDWRCGTTNTVDRIEAYAAVGKAGVLSLDGKQGRLLVPLTTYCFKYQNPGSCSYGSTSWIAAFSGFTTDLEVLQTYSPDSGPISFRVPYMPEGFPAAYFFDTYYGDLATVGDWSQAQPLQCGYPASAPSVGDYLTVDDALPDPAPGHGRYYVTAVSYQGQRRYGRKSSGGVLSGRDPAVLPACGE